MNQLDIMNRKIVNLTHETKEVIKKMGKGKYKSLVKEDDIIKYAKYLMYEGEECINLIQSIINTISTFYEYPSSTDICNIIIVYIVGKEFGNVDKEYKCYEGGISVADLSNMLYTDTNNIYDKVINADDKIDKEKWGWKNIDAICIYNMSQDIYLIVNYGTASDSSHKKYHYYNLIKYRMNTENIPIVFNISNIPYFNQTNTDYDYDYSDALTMLYGSYNKNPDSYEFDDDDLFVQDVLDDYEDAFICRPIKDIHWLVKKIIDICYNSVKFNIFFRRDNIKLISQGI